MVTTGPDPTAGTSRVWQQLLEGPPISAPRPADTAELPRRHHRANRPTFRADVEGLRAVAVVLVILDHLAAWPRGGFVGVDVFFVISGYLITGLLLKSAAGPTSVPGYFADFYRRRAKRILPAAIVVLVASWVAANLVFRGARIAQTHTDIWWAFAFLANVHFSNIGTDYFQQSEPASLVQHYWSLAVEEQFYVIWPVVLLICFGLLRLRSRRRYNSLLAVTGTLTAVSFVLALHESSRDSTAAYFSTVARAWELGAGAMLAILLVQHPKLADRWPRMSGPLSFFALVIIILSASLIRPGTSFPAPAAIGPVLATVVVLFAGAGTRTVRYGWTWPLTNPCSRYVGRVSFSLYLWHWPTIIICSALLGGHTALRYAVSLMAMTGLTILSYHLIEEPFHRPRGAERPDRRTVSGFALAGVALVVAAVGLYTLKPPAQLPPGIAAAATATAQQGVGNDPSIASVSAVLSDEIRAAIGATKFPNLSPGLSRLGLGAAQTDVWNGCNTLTSVIDSCTFGGKVASGKQVALVAGDSVAMNWIPAVRAALKGWVVVGFARGECPASFVSISGKLAGGANAARTCDEHHRSFASVVSALRPNVVILSNTEATLGRLGDGARGAAAVNEYQEGLVQANRAAAAHGALVVDLSPPPVGKSLLACDTAGTVPSDCVSRISAQWLSLATADRAAAQVTHSHYLNTSAWFCSDSEYCPAFVGSTPVMYDGVHLTKAYATVIAPELAAVLAKLR